ncbi:uncharacterized protein BXZ73DRAFT_83785 [Epithele typhae]|uniref:uncharacterized protein n=1 Tax=Epithele typhae TaxID=378194 RepID=UPI0020075C4F|nr:uncharacterized protein BXZ73DRAFT_83785 [Epithele typhae]KAH9910263.1 hypothetical protein BXZ73DRAFT_83785 [Epithele typhae]
MHDPVRALREHIAFNKPGKGEALFSHTIRSSRRPLTLRAFTVRIRALAAEFNFGTPSGHSLRIGSLLCYALNGFSLADCMVKGRWHSQSSFQLYLRKHADVLQPHLVVLPHVWDDIQRAMMQSQAQVVPQSTASSAEPAHAARRDLSHAR